MRMASRPVSRMLLVLAAVLSLSVHARAQRAEIVPIPGTTNVTHLEENVGAAALSLTAEELQELDRDLAAITIQGDRLPPAVLAGTGVEAPPMR